MGTIVTRKKSGHTITFLSWPLSQLCKWERRTLVTQMTTIPVAAATLIRDSLEKWQSHQKDSQLSNITSIKLLQL